MKAQTHKELIQIAAIAFARKGGQTRTPAKIAAARANGKLGGRPPKHKPVSRHTAKKVRAR